MADIILRAENITKCFGGIRALDKASLSVKKGEVHALVGANGAGKSTLIKIITGAYTSDEGSVYLDGKLMQIHSTFDARALGISAVYQEFSLINTISVAENIFMGKLITRKVGPISQVNWEEINNRSAKILETLGTKINPKDLVGSLSVAQKQMVEIAKALSNDIKVLIMDEPTASLAENDIKQMFEVLRGLQKKGISIIYVSHRLEELPQIANRISVYRDGNYIRTLEIDDAPKQVIIENMVGKKVEQINQQNHSQDEILLETKNLSAKGKFEDINLTLHKGEILGLAGLDGAGRTEIVRALFGADKHDSGQILISDKEVTIKSPRDAKKAGIGFITEDRKEEGAIMGLDISTNIGMTILKELSKHHKLDLNKEKEVSTSYIKSLAIKCSSERQKVGNLSGGNQQKVVVAKWLATKPKILIMDEPTRGIDVGAKNQIYELIHNLSKQGIGIILISSDLPELLQMSNNIVVIAMGRITAKLENKNLNQEILLNYATTGKKMSTGEVN